MTWLTNCNAPQTGCGRRRRLLACLLPAGLAFAAASFAGPPFVSDDAEPTEYSHFEAYVSSSGTLAAGETEGTAVGLEVDYGVLPQTEISIEVPLDFEPTGNGGTAYGVHELAFGAKYRLLTEEDGDPVSLAFGPSIAIPLTAEESLAPKFFLPVWLQKSLGEWTAFGGGGFNINPGTGNRDYWSFGAALVRPIVPDFSLGAEVFGQTAGEDGGQTTASIGIGALYDFSETWHLTGSVSTGFVGHREANEFSYYAGLGWSL